MTALAWPRGQTAVVRAQPWRRCVAVSVASAVLSASVVLVALAAGWSWPDAATVGVGGVGTWSLASSTAGLRHVLTGCSERLQDVSRAAPVLALGLSVVAVAVARMLGGPPLVVLGCVDVVVASAVAGVSAALAPRL